MRNRILGVCAGLILATASGPVRAATIQLSAIGDVPTVISAPGRVSQTFSNVLSSQQDLFGATVTAIADDNRGILKTFANNGGDVGALTPTQASASARVSGSGTITGPGSGPVQGRLLYSFHAAADTLAGETGAAVGGFVNTIFNVSADVGTFFNIFRPGSSPITGFTTARASAQYLSQSLITASSPSTIANVQSQSGITASSVFRNSPGFNNVLSDSDIRINFSRVNDFTVEGLMEILFTAQIGDRMRFSADMEALADAAPGHIGVLNALNTGTLNLDLPDGFGFVPDDGIFLTQQTALSTVPLPPSVALLLAGLTGLGLLKRRRSDRGATA